MQDFTGVPAVVDLAAMRDAMVALGGDPEEDQPAGPGRPGHRPFGPGRRVRHRGAFERNVELEYERNGERYAFLRWGSKAFDNFRVVPPGTGICHQVNLEYLAQVVWTAQGGQQGGRLSRHAGRHRQPHHHGQRPGRAGLGRGRHRGRGGDAGPAGLDADPRGRRLQAHRRAAGRRDRDRPRADRHPDAAQEGRGRQVRRVLRPRRRQAAAGRPRHHRQHGARVRRHLRLLPDRRGDARLSAAHRPRARADRAGRGLRQGAGHVAPRRRWPIRCSPTRSSSTSAPSSRRWPARSGRRTACRSRRPSRASRTAWPSLAGDSPADAKAPVKGTDYRAAPRRRRDRRDHQLHQHQQSRAC